MATVDIRDIRKRFGEHDVIDGIDIAIEDGQFVVLVGPSGCGKSTLLRMIAGLEPISDGEIAIDGRVVNALRPRARDIAMVFQNYALYPHMNVRANMGFSLKMRGDKGSVITERVGQAAHSLGLGELLEYYPSQLSGGQRQRVAMGRAIVRDPQVFLFDEPLSNLDAQLRVQMRTEIKALHQRLGTTMVYVTHDQIEAMTMADKIVVLHDGRVEQIGAPLELFNQPANLFVAGFIGSPAMNLIEGTLRRKDDTAHVETGTGMHLPLDASQAGQDGQPVVYGIRPDRLSLVGARDGFAVGIEVVEPTGTETYLITHLGETAVAAVFRDRHDFAPGQTLHLRPEIDHVHLFDAEDGRRLAAQR